MVEKALVSIGQAWRAASQRIDRLDARLLVEHVAGCTHADLIAHPDRVLTSVQVARLDALLARRADGEPFAYLLGRADFCGLDFTVSPAVLIPRSDTEVLLGLAAERARQLKAPRIVDLGTGSGIVAIMLSRLCPGAELTAVDVSQAALDVASCNADCHGVRVKFLVGDWYAPLGNECFDIIVSNPPYVVFGDSHLDSGGLPFEPQVALTDGVAGGDGLACIRAIVSGANAHLNADGLLIVEHGYNQAADVRDLMTYCGFVAVSSRRDSAGIERVTVGRKGLLL